MGDVAACSQTWPLGRQGPSVLPKAPLGPRRCLFGPVDHETTGLWLREQFRDLAAESRSKWNFDFESEVPLPPGQYNWEECQDAGTPQKTEKKEIVQKRITDFMRKRKATSEQKPPHEPAQKVCRRSST